MIPFGDGDQKDKDTQVRPLGFFQLRMTQQRPAKIKQRGVHVRRALRGESAGGCIPSEWS